MYNECLYCSVFCVLRVHSWHLLVDTCSGTCGHVSYDSEIRIQESVTHTILVWTGSKISLFLKGRNPIGHALPFSPPGRAQKRSNSGNPKIAYYTTLMSTKTDATLPLCSVGFITVIYKKITKLKKNKCI